MSLLNRLGIYTLALLLSVLGVTTYLVGSWGVASIERQMYNNNKNGAEIVELITEIRTDRELTLVLCTHDDSLANRAERSIELVDGSANIL